MRRMCDPSSSTTNGQFNRRDWLACRLDSAAWPWRPSWPNVARPVTAPRRTGDPRPTHFPPKVKRVIHVFLEGGPSHVDLFDPKPELSRLDGKPISVPGENRKAPAFGSPFPFASAGSRAFSSAMPCPCWVVRLMISV